MSAGAPCTHIHGRATAAVCLHLLCCRPAPACLPCPAAMPLICAPLRPPSSSPPSLETLELLEKVTKNSAVQPVEEKYRRLKLRCAANMGAYSC